ncbi:squalene--hopene cyclase [Rhodopirellula sp.]|nr:squalene--hopene cyclase [Rhodopirellula sp.]MDB4678897.1 squalene--hopene cyclase [Rhodopirellula sp.]
MFQAVALILLTLPVTWGTEEAVVTLANVPDDSAITAEGPLSRVYSPIQAAKYLDIASLNWQKDQKCVTCHTNMAYLMARPALEKQLRSSGEVRTFFESQHTELWNSEVKKLRAGMYQPVVIATGLAFHDAKTTGKLSEVARSALDTMWETQRVDGGWTWAKCGWAPMEIDDHYGVTLAALAVGIAPSNYAETERAKRGIEGIRKFLAATDAPSLHHRMMIAWASVHLNDLMDEMGRNQVREEFLTQQLPDGGWSTAGLLSDWTEFKRKDGKPQDLETSDAYATGLVVLLSRELGTPVNDQRLQAAILWLKTNQRVSGQWFTRSPSKDSKHYFTNIGSAFAILALQSCGTIE